jgi:hypothetical protein
MVDLNLPAGLGIEADMMYRRVGYSNTASAVDGSLTSVFNSNAFTFPILLKYKFPGTLARMYISGGFAFRALSDVPQLFEATSKGLVLGGGIRYDLKVLKISPELRFTRWNNDVFDTNSGHGSTLNSKKSQVEFLVGITF